MQRLPSCRPLLAERGQPFRGFAAPALGRVLDDEPLERESTFHKTLWLVISPPSNTYNRAVNDAAHTPMMQQSFPPTKNRREKDNLHHDLYCLVTRSVLRVTPMARTGCSR